jgi:hypothetical protein
MAGSGKNVNEIAGFAEGKMIPAQFADPTFRHSRESGNPAEG